MKNYGENLGTIHPLPNAKPSSAGCLGMEHRWGGYQSGRIYHCADPPVFSPVEKEAKDTEDTPVIGSSLGFSFTAKGRIPPSSTCGSP